MVNYVNLNGATYSDGSSDEGTGVRYLANGGHKLNLLRAFTDMLVEVAQAVQAAVLAGEHKDAAAGHAQTASDAVGVAVPAAAAAAGAAELAGQHRDAAAQARDAALTYAAALHGTSATALDVGTGAKTLSTQASRQWQLGQYLIVSSAADPTAWMWGQVTAYAGTDLTLDVQLAGGAGNHADWVIAIAGVRGPQGVQGVQGPTGGYGWEHHTAAVAAVNGGLYRCDTSAGSFPVTLPAAPEDGHAVRVYGRSFSANSLTIDGNGATIRGDATFICDLDGLFTFVYAGPAATWEVF